jgi:frataxin-like iron-binding protein CyaY
VFHSALQTFRNSNNGEKVINQRSPQLQLWAAKSYGLQKVMGCKKLWAAKSYGLQKVMGCSMY